MILNIIRTYKTSYPDPITLNEGDVVQLGEKETKPEWSGWIRASKDGIEGWIPEQIVEILPDGSGKVTEFYTAKELDVNEGDAVTFLKELNGWYWVRHSLTNEEGWIPKEITEPTETN